MPRTRAVRAAPPADPAPLRRRAPAVCGIGALALGTLTACGEDYDPCWVDAETVAGLFSFSTVSQALNTEEPTVQTSGYTATATELGETGCSYDLTPEESAPSVLLVLQREEEVDAERFAQHQQEAEADDDSRVFVEEHREQTIVYSTEVARMIVGDHYYWARYTSSASLRADRGSDAQPLMQYVAGTQGGEDLEGYQAWLEEEALWQADEAEAAALHQAEIDHQDGYSAGLQDGEYEALHGYPPQGHHWELSERSEEWVRGFEEGKAEGLAAAPVEAPASPAEPPPPAPEAPAAPEPPAPGQGDQLVEWEDEYEDQFSESQGPLDDAPGESALAPREEGFDLGLEEGRWAVEDGLTYTEDAEFWNLYTEEADRRAFAEGYAEGYQQGYRAAWREAGRPEAELPAEAR
ncbi:hypothetical protein [Nesterenkonia jeotgali]|uniref:Uncharacterized protein n=1 Tax=Nesterenkonia jeotgali TaxID=317018 RepID=A0A0W8ICB3_9MICC|nr:hypothetical protein [Nesterenkonia jeotgali]KUG57585.1 hypothetical protein AVL63_13175 [Nesterenkonia jeotgali]